MQMNFMPWWCSARTTRSLRPLCFAADQIPDVVAVLVTARGLLDLELARPRQVDRHFLADAPGSRGEYDDAIAEIDRLLDVVRHEDNRFAGARPEAHHFL